MSDRKLALLGIIAVGLAALAVLQSRFGRTYTPEGIFISPLIEGLDIDQVQAIEITSKSTSEPLRLDRRANSFMVRNKGNYPANLKKVNSLISDCLDLRIASDALITANPDNHPGLGATPETARCGIEFLDEDQKSIVGIIISDTKTEGERSFSTIRLSGKNEVYQLQEVPYFSVNPMDYIDAQILQIDREQVVRVTVTDPNQSSFTLTGPDDGSEIVLDVMPPGKQLKKSDARTLFGSLSYLRIDDVLSASGAPSLEYKCAYVCELNNHVVYTLRLAEADGKHYMRLSARYTGPEPEVQKQVESAEQLKEREALFLAKDSAESFTRRHAGWVYVIPSYKAGEMTRSLGELLEDIPQPKSEEESENPGSTQ